MDRLYENLLGLLEQGNWPEALKLARKILLSRKNIDRETYHLLLAAGIDGHDVEFTSYVGTKFRHKFMELRGKDLFYLGRVALLENNYYQAEWLFNQALADEELTGWYRGAAESIYATFKREMGCPAEAVTHYRLAAQYKNMEQGKLAEYSNMLFNMQYLQVSPEEKLAAAKGYGKLLENVPRYEHKSRRHEKIRIGYLSPDLRFHVVAFFSYALFHDYDRQKFAVYCYTNCLEDKVSSAFAAMVDGWHNVRGCSFPQIAARIFADEIDILVDLAGHTAHNMLPVLAYKPAPIQMSAIGYFATTGMTAVDYFLVDRYTAPPEEKDNFSEQLLYMPASHFCYTWHEAELSVGDLPCKGKGYITFGSLNNFSKVNSKVLSLWKEILQAVPHSRLYLKAGIFNVQCGRDKVTGLLEDMDIPLERVIMAHYEGDYLHAYREIDIALDTFPYPGGGTTCDALYMGVPVITLTGNSHNSRFGYSLMMNVGLKECCAFSEKDYVQKAVALADNVPRLEKIRKNLRNDFRNCPVMQAADYMRELEKNYSRIYDKFRSDNDEC